MTIQPSPNLWANHASMNEHIMPAMSGTPDYEQKELRSNGKHVSAVLRMAWAELLPFMDSPAFWASP